MAMPTWATKNLQDEIVATNKNIAQICQALLANHRNTFKAIAQAMNLCKNIFSWPLAECYACSHWNRSIESKIDHYTDKMA